MLNILNELSLLAQIENEARVDSKAALNFKLIKNDNGKHIKNISSLNKSINFYIKDY